MAHRRKPDRVVVASDRIETYYEHATTMLEQGFGYVCRCSADEFKEYRVSKTNCPCRTQTPQDNMVFWKRMLNGNFKPGEAVVRVKTDMTLKNPARDWPVHVCRTPRLTPTLAQRLVPPTRCGHCWISRAPLKTISKVSLTLSEEKT